MRPFRGIAWVLLIVTTAACGGDGTGSGDPDAPWVTQVDSTGDTVRVRIDGAIPDSLVRTLVTDLEIGVEDGEEEETFRAVVSVVPTPDRGVIVYDAQADAVRQFGPTGAFVRNIGRKGGGPGEFGQVNGLAALPDGRILIWDGTNARINVYSDTGAYQALWRVPFASHFGQNMLWTDQSGRTFSWLVLKSDSNDFTKTTPGVIVYDANGAVIDTLVYPTWRDRAPALAAQSPDKRMTSSYNFPFWPANVAQVATQGGFVSGPGDPYVLYFTGRPGLKPVRVDRDFTPVPVSPTERTEARAEPEFWLRKVDPNWSWSGPSIPANKPAYDEITVTRDGRVWVSVGTPGVPIPATELAPVRPGEEKQPRTTTRSPTVYDVFSPEGRLLGRVAFPRRVALRDAVGNDVYATRRDSLDIQYVVRYRIEPALPR